MLNPENTKAQKTYQHDKTPTKMIPKSIIFRKMYQFPPKSPKIMESLRYWGIPSLLIAGALCVATKNI